MGYPSVTVTAPRLPADARRQQILDVAIEEFGRAGYFGTSMNDIAEAAGVTKPVLYQHFDSKADLYRALLDEVGSRILDAIAKATSDATDGRDRTERGFAAYFRWVSDHQQEFSLLFGGSARHERAFSAQIRRITDESASAIAGLIDVDLDPVHRDTIAHGLVGLAEGASRRLVAAGDPFDPDEIAAVVSRLAWAGLRSLDRSTA
jgi:AcrR family transcriptional regulator